ncbi:hypothetical protein ACFYXM_24740 [Streptomyces sp. NPDC002476]|uniref:hypothetical protein n=1 Tax=Streptomyces sp. NPDC002476 TaxID=3364648 RepID=UPI0036BE366D
MTTESLHSPYSFLTVDVPDDLPVERRVEVRIVSMDAEAARHVADALRLLFAGGEQRSYPALPSGRGTRLHLTLDPAERGVGPLRSWLEASRPTVDRTHPGETARYVRPPGRSAPVEPPAVASPPLPWLQGPS